MPPGQDDFPLAEPILPPSGDCGDSILVPASLHRSLRHLSKARNSAALALFTLILSLYAYSGLVDGALAGLCGNVGGSGSGDDDVGCGFGGSYIAATIAAVLVACAVFGMNSRVGKLKLVLDIEDRGVARGGSSVIFCCCVSALFVIMWIVYPVSTQRGRRVEELLECVNPSPCEGKKCSTAAGAGKRRGRRGETPRTPPTAGKVVPVHAPSLPLRPARSYMCLAALVLVRVCAHWGGSPSSNPSPPHSPPPPLSQGTPDHWLLGESGYCVNDGAGGFDEQVPQHCPSGEGYLNYPESGTGSDCDVCYETCCGQGVSGRVDYTSKFEGGGDECHANLESLGCAVCSPLADLFVVAPFDVSQPGPQPLKLCEAFCSVVWANCWNATIQGGENAGKVVGEVYEQYNGECASARRRRGWGAAADSSFLRSDAFCVKELETAAVANGFFDDNCYSGGWRLFPSLGVVVATVVLGLAW
jgi:hypothetical protein